MQTSLRKRLQTIGVLRTLDSRRPEKIPEAGAEGGGERRASCWEQGFPLKLEDASRDDFVFSVALISCIFTAYFRGRGHIAIGR